MLKVALSGCNGRMGRVITEICSAKPNLKIMAGFDISGEKHSDFPVYTDPLEFSGQVDVVVDFSSPKALSPLLSYATKNKTPLVLCTTGYSQEELSQIAAASKDVPLFQSGNMSMGINLMIHLLEKCAKILGPDFDVEIIEKHHNQKVDAPSGTALMLAAAVKNNLPYEAEYTYDRSQKREKRSQKEIGIHALRGGTIVGDHEVIFAGRDEIISLSHSAASREVFATGAVNAAIFLAKQATPGMYSMGDMLAEL